MASRVPQVSRFRDLGVGALHQFIGLPTIFNLTYNFNLGNGDNGNVMQIVNGRDSNRTQNFVYDSLNRVSQAYSSGPNWRVAHLCGVCKGGGRGRKRHGLACPAMLDCGTCAAFSLAPAETVKKLKTAVACCIQSHLCKKRKGGPPARVSKTAGRGAPPVSYPEVIL